MTGSQDAGRAQETHAGRRALVLGLFITLLVIVASSSRFHTWLIGFLPAAEALIRDRPGPGATIFVLFAALAAMLAFVSSAVIVPIGVFVWGKGISLMLLLLGWVLGGVLTYSIGRYLGRPTVKALTSVDLLERYETRVSRKAPFGLVLLFQVALPSEIPGYLLGLVRYPFWRYFAALTLAELPFAFATVYLGESFVERRIPVLIGVGAITVAFSGFAFHLLHRRFHAQTN